MLEAQVGRWKVGWAEVGMQWGRPSKGVALRMSRGGQGGEQFLGGGDPHTPGHLAAWGSPPKRCHCWESMSGQSV